MFSLCSTCLYFIIRFQRQPPSENKQNMPSFSYSYSSFQVQSPNVSVPLEPCIIKALSQQASLMITFHPSSVTLKLPPKCIYFTTENKLILPSVTVCSICNIFFFSPFFFLVILCFYTHPKCQPSHCPKAGAENESYTHIKYHHK